MGMFGKFGGCTISGVMVKMGNSLNEVLPFLLGDGNISGIPYLNKSEMMASLGIFETLGGNSGTHNFGTHEMTKSEMAQNRHFHTTYI